VIRFGAAAFFFLMWIGVGILAAWLWSRIRLAQANHRLHRVQQELAEELERSGILARLEAAMVAEMETALEEDAEGVTFMTSSTREEAEQLVARYRRRHPKGEATT
jgi:hypothetical protein